MADTTLILKTLVEGTAEARKNIENVTKGVEELGKSGDSLGALNRGLAENAEGFRNIGIAAGVAFAGVVALGTMAVQQASKMQDLRQSFDTLLQSTEKGKKLFLEIQKMAVFTPYTSEELARATSTMLGFGVAQEKVLPIMTQLGDISLGNGDRFQRLALAFAQVSAAGRLTGQDLLQMVNAGFNPLQEISKKTGESIADLKEQMSDGRISVKMVEEAMISATSAGGRFEGGMVKASRTFSGVMSTFRDNIGITLAALGGFANGEVVKGGLLDSLTQALQKILPILDKVTQWANSNPEIARNILISVGAISWLIAGLVSLGFIIAPIAKAWAALSFLWTSAIVPAATAVGAAIAGISAPVWVVIGVIAALVAAGVALYKHWDQVVEFAHSTWEKITEVFQFGVNLVAGITIAVFRKMGIDIVGVFNNLVGNIKLAWEGIKILAEAGMNWIVQAVVDFTAPLTNAWGVLWGAMGDKVTSVWEGVKSTIKSSINYIIDMINRVIEAANRMASAGAGALGMRAVSLPTIPRLAEGGIVTKPTLAMIGEGNESEAVIPLSKLKNMGWSGITINFTGTFGQGVAEEIGDMIVSRLARAGAI